MTDSAELSSFPWYALKVRTRSEPTAVLALQTRGYNPFCPVHSQRRRYCDRIKKIEQALFPGYLFCRFDVQRKLPVISSNAVEYIVSVDGVPAHIPDDQIASIRLAAQAGAQPVPYLKTGRRVRVQFGSLAGVEGVLVRETAKGHLVLSVDLLQSSIALHIDEDQVCPV